MKDFILLKKTEHMLKWFSDTPYEYIFASIEDILTSQVKGSKISSFTVTSNPDWLSGGRKDDKDSNKVILVRAAVAFEFRLVVESPAYNETLNGVFTLAAINLDTKDIKHRVWFDINGTLEEFGSNGELKERVYFVE